MSGRSWLLVILLVSLGVNAGLLLSRWVPVGEESGQDVEIEAPVDEAERIVGRFADRLRLDGSARERFVEVHTGFFDEMLEGRREARRAEARLRRELTSARPDREAIERSLDDLSAARARLEAAFVHALLDAREMLEPRQQAFYFRALRRLRGADPPKGPGGPGRPEAGPLGRGVGPGPGGRPGLREAPSGPRAPNRPDAPPGEGG